MIDEEFDSHLYMHTNALMPIGTSTIEIDYFNIAKDQLGRIVILRPEWKYYLLQDQQVRHVYLFHYEYQTACLNHNSMKLEELAWVLLLLICRTVL
jgi:hypothetical protein